MPAPARHVRRSGISVLAGLAVGLGLSGSLASAQSEQPVNPFVQRGTAVASTSNGDADLDALQFCGLSSIGDERAFNFTDSRTRKSFWLSSKSPENGFSIDSYDVEAEQVIVRRGGRTRTMTLRKSVPVAVAPSPVVRPNVPPPVTVASATAPAGPPGAGVDEIKNPKTPEEVKQAEYEARMLVSDLLDISMRERERQRALREAQARGQAPANR